MFRNQAEEADKKYDEVARRLQQCEADLDRAEERADTGETKVRDLRGQTRGQIPERLGLGH